VSKRLIIPVGAAVLVALGVSGCSDVRKSMGLDRSPPDEFAVLSRAPLSMPPDFSLRPPQPGAARPQEPAMRDEARAVVLRKGNRINGSGGISAAEAALLEQAGGRMAEPDIRQRVDAETAAVLAADRRWTEGLLFWRESTPRASIVDAREEAKRLKENAAQGKPVTAGETPRIERKSSGRL
jgi:hypothetical protein